MLRALWTQDVVTFEGRWHHIDAAGINPLPVQRPIPIWIGGGADAVLSRMARIGDGWFPQSPPDEQSRTGMAELRGYIAEAGRKVEDVGIEPRLNLNRVAETECGGLRAGMGSARRDTSDRQHDGFRSENTRRSRAAAGRSTKSARRMVLTSPRFASLNRPSPLRREGQATRWRRLKSSDAT